jgi:hypothetical protein
MDAGHSLHVRDLKVGAGIEIQEDSEAVVAAIATISESVLETQTEAGAEPEVAGEAPAEDAGE